MRRYGMPYERLEGHRGGSIDGPPPRDVVAEVFRLHLEAVHEHPVPALDYSAATQAAIAAKLKISVEQVDRAELELLKRDQLREIADHPDQKTRFKVRP